MNYFRNLLKTSLPCLCSHCSKPSTCILDSNYPYPSFTVLTTCCQALALNDNSKTITFSEFKRRADFSLAEYTS